MMETPHFSTITDMHSPTQLRRALWEASCIAMTLCDMARYLETPDEALREVVRRLNEAAADAALMNEPAKVTAA